MAVVSSAPAASGRRFSHPVSDRRHLAVVAILIGAEKGRCAARQLAPRTGHFVRQHEPPRKSAAATFFHPDYTVGPGVSPGRGNCRPSNRMPLDPSLAGSTADRELD